MANSPATPETYLRFKEAFGKTKLTPALRGLIAVAVAEINGCDYSLSTAMTRDGEKA
jgi:alkylhydroperoxidase family enzyme